MICLAESARNLSWTEVQLGNVFRNGPQPTALPFTGTYHEQSGGNRFCNQVNRPHDFSEISGIFSERQAAGQQNAKNVKKTYCSSDFLF